jgi:hypothetical protein
MTPVKQTKFHDIDGKGNCLEACCASLLDMKIEDVPDMRDEKWFGVMWNLFQDHGYEIISCMDTDNCMSYKGIDGYYIVAGESPRGVHIPGGHGVIYKNGKLVHDPHPDNTGLIDPWYGIMIEPKKKTNEIP